MDNHEDNQPFRILVIDDNSAIHGDFRRILSKLKTETDDLPDMESTLFGTKPEKPARRAFNIDSAFQGQEGLALVQKARRDDRPYALAFVDGRMPPGWDGIETISHLWQECPDLQVVLCTAFSDYSWEKIQRVLGVSDNLLILKKPFDNMEALQMAHALTRKWEQNRDIQGRLNQLAFYDHLTGLPNRVLFMDRLTLALDQARRYQHKGALLFLDLDGFKRINDTLGHSAGDEMLKITAERLLRCLRTSDSLTRLSDSGMASRLGGDEFTMILPRLDHPQDAAVVTRRIAEIFSRPVYIGKQAVIVTPSIGITIFTQDGDTVEVLLKNADQAMYLAKRMGPNTFKYYSEVLKMQESSMQ